MQPTLASKLRLMNPTTEVIATIGLAGQAIKASEKDCKIEIWKRTDLKFSFTVFPYEART